MDKLGFAFLTIDNLYNSDLWLNWLDYNRTHVSIHAKLPSNLKSDLLRQRVCSQLTETQWGGFGLVEASYLMFKDLFQYPDVKKVVLVSDSCLPAKKFDDVYSKLLSNNQSYFFCKSLPKWKEQRCHTIIPHFSSLYNQSQWCILTREAFDIIDKDFNYYKTLFQKVYCSDEHFFINILKDKNYTDINNFKYHYFRFSNNSAHPDILEEEQFQTICNKKEKLFMRKYIKPLDRELWPIII